jgi:cell division protein FtsB
MIWGQKGYLQYKALEEKFHSNLKDFQKFRAQRVILENKAALLNRNSLDIDSLDEQVRQVLGLAKANEIVLPAD